MGYYGIQHVAAVRVAERLFFRVEGSKTYTSLNELEFSKKPSRLSELTMGPDSET